MVPLFRNEAGYFSSFGHLSMDAVVLGGYSHMLAEPILIPDAKWMVCSSESGPSLQEVLYVFRQLQLNWRNTKISRLVFYEDTMFVIGHSLDWKTVLCSVFCVLCFSFSSWSVVEQLVNRTTLADISCLANLIRFCFGDETTSARPFRHIIFANAKTEKENKASGSKNTKKESWVAFASVPFLNSKRTWFSLCDDLPGRDALSPIVFRHRIVCSASQCQNARLLSSHDEKCALKGQSFALSSPYSSCSHFALGPSLIISSPYSLYFIRNRCLWVLYSLINDFWNMPPSLLSDQNLTRRPFSKLNFWFLW